jgi:hypothetical protein
MRELAMTKEQYEIVMKEIEDHHSWGKHGFSDGKCKYIKYVRPNWDMRDGLCFSINFDGLACGIGGITFGSGYGETTPLYDRVMEWLNKPFITSNN